MQCICFMESLWRLMESVYILHKPISDSISFYEYKLISKYDKLFTSRFYQVLWQLQFELVFVAHLVHFIYLRKDTRKRASSWGMLILSKSRAASSQEKCSESNLNGNEVEKHCPWTEWEDDMSNPSLEVLFGGHIILHASFQCLRCLVCRQGLLGACT